MDADTGLEVKKTRKRSPNYPVIDLEKAVTRMRELYEKDKGHPVAIGILHERWGYTKMSGMLQQTVAALKAYGFVEIAGMGNKRTVRVSETGRKIIFDHQDKDNLIKEAALRPKIFAHLWEKYRTEGLPQDDVIKHYLLFDYENPFNEDVLDDVIGRFRHTVSFAKLAESDIIPEGKGTLGDSDGETEQGKPNQFLPPPNNPPKPEGKMKNFTFPLMDGDVATLQVPHPMTESNFNVLMGIINAYKPAMISKPTATDEVTK